MYPTHWLISALQDFARQRRAGPRKPPSDRNPILGSKYTSQPPPYDDAASLIKVDARLPWGFTRGTTASQRPRGSSRARCSREKRGVIVVWTGVLSARWRGGGRAPRRDARARTHPTTTQVNGVEVEFGPAGGPPPPTQAQVNSGVSSPMLASDTNLPLNYVNDLDVAPNGDLLHVLDGTRRVV